MQGPSKASKHGARTVASWVCFLNGVTKAHNKKLPMTIRLESTIPFQNGMFCEKAEAGCS